MLIWGALSLSQQAGCDCGIEQRQYAEGARDIEASEEGGKTLREGIREERVVIAGEVTKCHGYYGVEVGVYQSESGSGSSAGEACAGLSSPKFGTREKLGAGQWAALASQRGANLAPCHRRLTREHLSNTAPRGPVPCTLHPAKVLRVGKTTVQIGQGTILRLQPAPIQPGAPRPWAPGSLTQQPKRGRVPGD